MDRPSYLQHRLTPPDARARGYSPITRPFSEEERLALLAEVRQFEGCRIVIVAVPGGTEIWRFVRELAPKECESRASTVPGGLSATRAGRMEKHGRLR